MALRIQPSEGRSPCHSSETFNRLLMVKPVKAVASRRGHNDVLVCAIVIDVLRRRCPTGCGQIGILLEAPSRGRRRPGNDGSVGRRQENAQLKHARVNDVNIGRVCAVHGGQGHRLLRCSALFGLGARRATRRTCPPKMKRTPSRVGFGCVVIATGLGVRVTRSRGRTSRAQARGIK